MSKFKGTQNWQIRKFDNSEDSFFFIEADLPNAEKSGLYPRIEVMQEDYGDHNGYTKQLRMADAKLIIAAPKMLATIQEMLGVAAWIGDEKCKQVFLKKMNEAISEALS